MVSEWQRKTCHLLFSSDPSDLFRSEKLAGLPCDSILHEGDVKPSQVILPYEELSRNSWRELFEGSYLSYLRNHPGGQTIVTISE